VKRLLTLVVASLLVVVAPTASGTRTDANVKVTITRGGCVVSPRAIEAGAAVFRIANRSGRPAAFSVAGKRTSVAPGRQVRLALTVRAGRIAYSCAVASRRVGGGSLRVAAVPQPPVEHRISVRDVSGAGEFYDRVTGAKFVPRGHSYIRLGPMRHAWEGTITYHSTFIVGSYDAAAAGIALKRMAAGGYNVVRVFVHGQCVDVCVVDSSGEISRAYVANVVDFLRRAQQHGIYVVLTQDFLPDVGSYASEIIAEPRDLVDNVNLNYLTERGLAANARFWSDFVRELRRQRAPFDAIFSFLVRSEANLVADARPFTLTAGSITLPGGRAYDLSSWPEKKQLVEDSLVLFVDRMRSAIRRVDPTALVGIGFFHDTEPNPARPGDVRLVRSAGAIRRSQADYVDIHPYPRVDLTLPQFMQNYGISGPMAKPIVMGEFGAFHFAFPTASVAAAELVDWQRRSCAFGIDGWLLWTWDTGPQRDGWLWNALDDGGVMEQALSPKNRPDPCG
jgi:hypothetical protein